MLGKGGQHGMDGWGSGHDSSIQADIVLVVVPVPPQSHDCPACPACLFPTFDISSDAEIGHVYGRWQRVM